MPLFMDFHKGLEVTVEDVKKAHMADVSVQEKYKVKYHQFWINKEAGMIFCLIEGPDKESCAKVHQEVHGNVACSITEVETGFYDLLMGQQQRVDHGLVHFEDGSIDVGCRNILIVEITGPNNGSSGWGTLETRPEDMIIDYFKRYEGRSVKNVSDDVRIGIFDIAINAIHCAIEIQKALLSRINIGDNIWNIHFRIGLAAGQPVAENEELFAQTFSLARMLVNINTEEKINISSMVLKLCDQEVLNEVDSSLIRSFTPKEEAFIVKLMDAFEYNIDNEGFNVADLSHEIGISKAQLYRKMIILTGRSPNEFMRAFRINKAYHLIKNQHQNISEIAFSVGFNNPSYFTKCFIKEYGISPSKMSALTISKTAHC